MKKWFLLCLTAALSLSLTACGSENGDESKAVWEAAHVMAVADAGAFSEELEPLDAEVAFNLYCLGDYGVEQSALEEATVLRSAGATCEEIAVLQFVGEENASLAMDALKDYVQNQIDSNTDYRPAEIPKLENVWLERKGYTVLMVVANDMDLAKAAVG